MTRFPTQLECPDTVVAPGEPLRCLLRVYNPADAIDEFTVVGLDHAAGWVSTEPPSLPLLPEKDGELDLIVTIPEGAHVPAGEHHIVVEIRPSLDEVAPQTEDLRVNVAEVTDAQLDITAPVETSAEGDVSATLAVANRGNHPLRLRFDVVDHDHDLPLRIDPWSLDLDPFTVRTVPVTLPLGSCPARDRHTHRLEVTATADGGLTRAARHTVTHEPSRPPPDPALRWPPPVWQWLLATVGLFALVPLLVAIVAGLEFFTATALIDTFGGLAVAVAVAACLVGAAVVAYYPGALSMARATSAEGAAVEDFVADAAVRQLAGILLLLPGLVTDVAGALLLVPAIGHAARPRVSGRRGRARSSTPEGGARA